MSGTKGTLGRAIELAAHAHAGQVDKGGQPYILHPLRVMVDLQIRGYEGDTLVAAVLHDVVEDTEVGLGDLVEFGADVINTVHALTKLKAETYAHYINRVSQDPAARPIKLADLRDNTRPERLTTPALRRLAATRYARALAQLEGSE